MEFMNSRPDIIRSSTQRWLIDHWRRLRGPAPLPPSKDLQFDALAIPNDDLSLTKVLAGNGDERFQVISHGRKVGELYGPNANCIGKCLDEILPAAALASALPTYRHVVASQTPVYTVSDLRDRGGRIVHYERLLLPFGSLGVEQILASLETVSPEGAVMTEGLMISLPKPPSFALCTTIHC
jgi:hypothetical protein